ncbi:MAG TPA: hypothetical protein VGQ91_16785 [Ideonella sp.]|jgi:ketosteroid isomerase-like protein|nr:hypothetical protein [Ideonella sp.]
MSHTATRNERTETSRTDTHRHEVQQFLDRFAKALTAGDVAAVVSLWQVPAYVLSDTDIHPVGSRAEIEQFFAGAKDRYNAQGVVSTRAEISQLRWPTERIAIAEVRWPYLDAQGREVGEENSTYTLRRNDEDELRLCVTLMHGTAEQPKHIGKPRH